jgi:hypothetical protein
MRGSQKVLPGLAAGLCATGAMSALLGVADRLGVMDRQPPRLIVASLLPVRPTSTLTNSLAVVAHIGYGTAVGAAFSLLPEPVPHSVKLGTAYGALIYIVGYEGWLPMLDILPPAHRDDPRRVATMVASHLVYGASLGYVYRKLTAGDEWAGSRRAASSVFPE